MVLEDVVPNIVQARSQIPAELRLPMTMQQINSVRNGG